MYGGKTTAANLMLKHLDATIIPFAKPLKEFARLLGWNGEKDTKGRRLLQLLGTECGRKCISDNIWVDKWLEQALACKTKFVISDDCRFMNECEAILRYKGKIIKVVGRETQLTPIQEIKKRMGLQYCHPSEKPLPSSVPMGYLVNSGSLFDLENNVRTLCEVLNGSV